MARLELLVMIVDAYRFETCWIIIDIQSALITGLRGEESTYAFVFEEERAPVFAETHFQPSLIYGWRQSPPAEPV